MSIEYIATGLETCLSEEGIVATPEQITRMARRFELGMTVMEEATGIVEQTKAGAPKKSPEAVRIERLLEIINRLCGRLGRDVSVDESAMELVYYTPVGTSHMGTTRARL